jgi:hypothetical protein
VFGPVGNGGRPQVGGPAGGFGRPPGGAPNASGIRSSLPGLGGLSSLERPALGNSSTPAVNRQALANQANLVRNNFNINNNYGNCFNGDWWGQHSGAWRAAGWERAAAAAAVAYSYPTWAASYGYCGYGGYSEPTYYDYGSNVVYEREYVYVNGDAVATQEEYGQQASSIADAGKQAQTSQSEIWLSLGVFAVIQGEQSSGSDLFQLAINRAGVIRGNCYNALSDTSLPVVGSVDKKSQRAAWTITGRNTPVFEAGYANLTKSETTMLVHFSAERAQQWTLVRMEQPTVSGENRP